MKKITFVNDSEPYLSAENLNQLQDNIEEHIDGVTSYSTTEQIIGTWIDGKPIYRKVINVNSLPEATRTTITLDINYNKIITIRGMASNGTTHIPIPWADENNISNVMKCFVQENNLMIDTGSDRTNYGAFFVVEYTKTT